MKFKQAEHDAFKKVIIDNGMDYADFTFTKKKGWLSVNYSSSISPFMYHRKSETGLNQEGQWEDYEMFFVKLNTEKVEYSEFRDVLVELSKWLRSK